MSISLGSSARDAAVVVELLGEPVSIERIGTDGDMARAARLFAELDGNVAALGVGGADLGALIDGRFHRFWSVQRLVRGVHRTPVVDGSALKNSLENRAAGVLNERLGGYLDERGRRAFVLVGVDRWGLATGFPAAGFDTVYGDLMAILHVPIALHSPAALKRLAGALVPVVSRLPFRWLYPVGAHQDQRRPRFARWFEWATVVAGDCHYVNRHMPDRLDGTIIVTNTTTRADMERFAAAGVRAVMTTTPVFEGRSFGTNALEAALVAATGSTRPLTPGECAELVDRLGIGPQLHEPAAR